MTERVETTGRVRPRPGSSSGELSAPARSPRSSQDLSRLGLAPPSDPRPTSRASFDTEALDGGRAGRLPLLVALVLALVLVAIPLYLWRRPRIESIAATNALTAPAPPSASAVEPAKDPAAPPPGMAGTAPEVAPPAYGVTVSEPRLVGCGTGTKKTSGESCDRLPTVERALARAVEESAGCAPRETGGSIQFAFDVGFRKKMVVATTPRDARSMKSAKVVASCLAQVKSRLGARILEGVPHAHERYRVVVVAGYPAAPSAPRP